jgi:hypothetical protein
MILPDDDDARRFTAPPEPHYDPSWDDPEDMFDYLERMGIPEGCRFRYTD